MLGLEVGGQLQRTVRKAPACAVLWKENERQMFHISQAPLGVDARENVGTE